MEEHWAVIVLKKGSHIIFQLSNNHKLSRPPASNTKKQAEIQ